MNYKLITTPLHVNSESDAFVMFLERLECLRKKLGLTKAEVYQLIEISQPMVSMVRSGDRAPSIKMLRRLESAEREAGITPPSKPEASAESFQPLENIPEKIPMPGRVAEPRVEYGTVPALEHRLAELEKKMDRVLKLLEDMGHERHHV